MEINLSKDELRQLTTSVVDILTKSFTNNAIVAEVYDGADKAAKILVERHKPNDEIKWKSIDYMTPIVNKALHDNDLLERIVIGEVREYMSSLNFKQKTIDMLKHRIDVIQHELDTQDDNQFS